jgi:hypothetical protein
MGRASMWGCTRGGTAEGVLVSAIYMNPLEDIN